MDCDKLWHLSRKAAKQYAKRRHGRSPGIHFSTYECPIRPDLYHIGRLARPVIEGEATRNDIYTDHRNLIKTLGGDRMTTYTSATPGYGGGVRTDATEVAAIKPTSASPGDRTTGQLDLIMADLATYRFMPQVEVSATLARRLLDLNAKNNRNMKDKKIDIYARDMEHGRWREKTGQVLKIATDGTLIDGQNRLHAVVRSGAVIRFDLCFGVDPADIVVIDSHTPRSAADVIKTAGGGDLVRVSTIVKHVLAWEGGYPKGAAGSNIASPMEIRERYEQDPNLFEAAASRGNDCARHGVGTQAALGIAYFVLVVNDREHKSEVDDFFDQLVSGIYPMPDPSLHAPYQLREKLIRYRNEKLTRPEMLALIMRLWNRYNTFSGGSRVPVKKVQMIRSLDDEGLTNTNFPRPKKFTRG